MKRLLTIPFCLLPILFSCQSAVTFEVNIIGNNFTVVRDKERATLATPYEFKITPNRGYELYQDEERFCVTTKKFPDPILSGGYWSYNESTNIFRINGILVSSDITIKVTPFAKESLLIVNLGRNYQSYFSPRGITIESEEDLGKFTIIPNDNYKCPSTISSITENVDYAYTPIQGTNNYLLQIDKNCFYQNITVTIGDATPLG